MAVCRHDIYWHNDCIHKFTYEMTVDLMSIGEMTVNCMPIAKMTLDLMSIDRMAIDICL